jgi:hypothetical protein
VLVQVTDTRANAWLAFSAIVLTVWVTVCLVIR